MRTKYTIRRHYSELNIADWPHTRFIGR